ncbi:MAG TPA: tetratricopeptide repeat protein [Gemmataceae bacterium]|nr:tetratricopeptide repeat protein [Gemmataceae bacterium]
MRTAGWLMGVVAASALASSAHAQGITIGSFKRLDDLDPPGGKRLHLVYFSSSPYLGVYASMPCCSYPVTRVSFFQPYPGLVSGPPVLGIAAARPLYGLDPDLVDLLASIRHPRLDPSPAPVPAPIDPGAPTSVFRPILPEDRLRALQGDAPAMPAPPLLKGKPPAALKANPPKDDVPPPAPKPPAPEVKPRVENMRQIRMGREAFAAREYSRAERRFQDAVTALPQEAPAYFLLAQAQFAQGKYQEAVLAIQAGLRLNSNWPAALFWPRDLYEGNVADYVAQIKTLTETQTRYGDDPVLLFLIGYELWFDDRRDEARVFFKRAAAKSPDPTFCYRFVPPLPKIPLVIW